MRLARGKREARNPWNPAPDGPRTHRGAGSPGFLDEPGVSRVALHTWLVYLHPSGVPARNYLKNRT